MCYLPFLFLAGYTCICVLIRASVPVLPATHTFGQKYLRR